MTADFEAAVPAANGLVALLPRRGLGNGSVLAVYRVGILPVSFPSEQEFHSGNPLAIPIEAIVSLLYNAWVRRRRRTLLRRLQQSDPLHFGKRRLVKDADILTADLAGSRTAPRLVLALTSGKHKSFDLAPATIASTIAQKSLQAVYGFRFTDLMTDTEALEGRPPPTATSFDPRSLLDAETALLTRPVRRRSMTIHAWVVTSLLLLSAAGIAFGAYRVGEDRRDSADLAAAGPCQPEPGQPCYLDGPGTVARVDLHSATAQPTKTDLRFANDHWTYALDVDVTDQVRAGDVLTVRRWRGRIVQVNVTGRSYVTDLDPTHAFRENVRVTIAAAGAAIVLGLSAWCFWARVAYWSRTYPMEVGFTGDEIVARPFGSIRSRLRMMIGSAALAPTVLLLTMRLEILASAVVASQLLMLAYLIFSSARRALTVGPTGVAYRHGKVVLHLPWQRVVGIVVRKAVVMLRTVEGQEISVAPFIASTETFEPLIAHMNARAGRTP